MLSDLVVVEKRLERLEEDRKKIKNPELDRRVSSSWRSAKRPWMPVRPCGRMELD